MAHRRSQKAASSKQKTSVVQRLIMFVIDLPRLVRIVLVALFGLAVTLSLSPLVDLIYSRYFFSVNTVMVPALVSSAFGLAMYMVGWWLVVGTVGEKPETRTAILWYVAVGLAAVVVVVVLTALGVSILNTTI